MLLVFVLLFHPVVGLATCSTLVKVATLIKLKSYFVLIIIMITFLHPSTTYVQSCEFF